MHIANTTIFEVGTLSYTFLTFKFLFLLSNDDRPIYTMKVN